MIEKNKRLMMFDEHIVENITCYEAHEKHQTSCLREQCDQWIRYDECQNCVLIAAKHGPHTLQKIGQIYGLSRMRICQIEKNIFEKIKQIS